MVERKKRVDTRSGLIGKFKNSRREFLRFTIGVKFVSLVVLVALLAGGIVGLVTIKISRDTLRQEILHNNLSQADLAADFVFNHMKGTQKPLEILAARADIREAVLNDKPEELQATLAEFVQTQTVLLSCSIFDAAGIQRVNSLKNASGLGQYFADREWFQQAVTTGQPFQGVPIISRAGNPSSPYAIPILDDQGQVRAVMTGSISLAILSAAFVNIDYGTDTRATLIDIRHGGTIVADRDPQLLAKPVTLEDEAVNRLLAGESGMIETSGSAGALNLVGFTAVPDLPWGIMVITPSSSALAIVDTLTHNVGLLTTMFIILAAIIGIILVVGITRQIHRLVEGIQEISRGNLDYKVAIKSRDEIGDLSHEFSNMAETLKKTLVSRDNLTKEIAERLTVEETLKRTLVSRDELEREVAERKKTEQSLNKSEGNFRNSMDASPMGIRIVTESGETLYANRSVLDIFGYDSLEELKATPLKKRCTPATYEEYRIRLDKRQRGEPVQDKNEISIVRKDGAIRHLQIFRKEVLWGGKPQYQVIYQDITERKQAEDEIQEANSWLSYTQEAANAGFWDWDMITGKLKWSKEFFKLFGLGSESKPTFDTWLQVLHPNDREIASSRIEKSIQDHTELYNEYRIVLPEGKVRWIGAIGKTLYDNDGKAQRMSGICIDISERKSIEQSLLSSEENFRNSMDNSPLGIRIVAESGETLYNNQAFLDIFGYDSLAELEAVPFKKRYSPESYVVIQKRIDRRKRGEPISGNNEISIVHKNGMRRQLQVLYKEALWGGKLQYQAFYLDITERKQTEEALITSEENFRNSIDSSPFGIRIVDKDGETLYANQALLDIFGDDSLEEYLATSFKNRFTPESLAEYQIRKDMRLRGELVLFGFECSIVRKDGVIRHLQVFRSEVLWGGKKRYQVLFQDITERKQAEETLKLASAQLEESYQKEKQQRLELQEEARARGMFIDILGHELRTPLTPLTVCADMLQTIYGSQEGGVVKELAENISTSTKLLAKRLEELLDLAKYTRGDFTLHLQRVNLADLINQTALRFKPLNQQEGQSLLLEIQPGLPEIEADPSSLEQVLVNLLSNAHKYSPKDSHITLKARKQDSNLIIEVQDEGQGVSPDEQQQLFNPYHRVRQDTQKYSGIGLGLAISKQIVEAHQGKIWVESQSGQGNTFIVQLPINHKKGGN